MPVVTRSQTNKNKYLKMCTTLHQTANALRELYDNIEFNNYKHLTWRNEVHHKVYDFVNLGMKPTFDDIDDMLTIIRVMLDNRLKFELMEFIFNCPMKFIVTFVNNSETAPRDLLIIEKMRLANIYAHLMTYVDDSKLKTWNDRYNTHRRGEIAYHH